MPQPGDADALYVLYDDAPCGLLVTRADGTIVRVNATFCRWTGHPADELVGARRLQDLLTVGGRIFHQTHWLPLLQMQGSVAEVKVDLLGRDGRALPMLMNAVRRDDAAGVRHEVALLVVEDRHRYERELLLARRRADDLLARERLAEARLRVALDSAGLYVWEVDTATGERRYDDQVARLLGHPAPRAVDPAAFAAAIDPGDRDREAAALADAIAGSPAEYRCTYRLNGVDGQKRTIRSTARGVSEAAGAAVPVRMVGVLHDATEAVALQAAAEDRAVFAEQMVGIVGHDLRNPLSAIKMSALLLGRSALDGTQRTVLERIVGSVDRARRLVADLLDFTRSRIGPGLAVTPEPIDLERVVAAAVDELAPVFDGRTLKHEHSGEGCCTADPHRLNQLVGNLVTNAMAYGASDRPVTVTSRIDAESLSIAVHNEGTPIPAPLLARMFDPMTRGDPADGGASVGHSVGLGLYIVRQIARAHRGEVSVVSTAEGGTTFTATLPRRG